MLTQPERWTLEQWQRAEQFYLNERLGLKTHLVLKRVLDITLATLGLVIAFPLLLISAIAIWLSSPGPILFVQERVGQFGTPFQIYKFRTMVDGAIHLGTGLDTFEGDPRVTAVGKVLREYHLDELPQLFNVLRGEMSLVGPRPLLPETLDTYSDREKRRLLVPPGITAWEAVNGGLDNDVNERLQLDLWYVDHWSIGLDLEILWRTIPVVLRKEGVYADPDSQQSR